MRRLTIGCWWLCWTYVSGADAQAPTPSDAHDVRHAVQDSASRAGRSEAGSPEARAAVDPRTPELEPPVVLSTPVVAFPQGEAPRDVTVLLLLSLDVRGHVIEALVLKGVSPRFDTLALDAARATTFVPAKQRGQPVAARIRYAQRIAPPTPVSAIAATSTPPPSLSHGRAWAAPAATAVAPEPAPPPSQASHARDRPDARATAVSVAEEADYEATAEVSAPYRETTRRSLHRADLRRVPGANADPVRSIEIVPGVGRAALGSNPLLRGAAPDESQVFFDGAPVPLLYHLGGLKSFVGADLVEGVDVFPSNFSPRYGRVTGGVVDVRARKLRRDALHGALELSLLDSSAFVEAPLGENAALLVGARRSNIDAVFEALVPEDSFRTLAAPVYWDYQAFVERDLSRDWTLELRAFGSRDSLRLFVPEGASEAPALRGAVGGSTEFHRGRLGVGGLLARQTRLDAYISLGTTRAQVALGPAVAQRFQTLDVDGRVHIQTHVAPQVSLGGGFDAVAQRIQGFYVGDQPPQSEGGRYDDPFGGQPLLRVEDTFWIANPAGYLELSLGPWTGVSLLPGVRIDYFGQLRHATVDPRFGMRATVTESTTLKAGAGRFSQAPNYWEALAALGNPELDPYSALHFSAGVEQALGETLTFDVEGFAKRISARSVAVDGGRPPFFVNDGRGRVVGAEFGAEWRPVPQSFGYLAYTLSRSERRDGEASWRVCDCDQTHILSAAANYDIGWGLSAGARFRLVSGNPRTPILGGVYDASRDLYRPIYGRAYSDRAPTFHQLDARVEKLWDFRVWTLNAYLDVQNALNTNNQEGLSYSYDYSKSEAATGLPIFPNLGLRGEL